MRKKAIVFFLFFMLIFFGSQNGIAQEPKEEEKTGFEADIFWVYPGITRYIGGVSGEILPHLGLSFKFVSDYKYRPLLARDEKGQTEIVLLRHHFSGSFVWCLGLFNYFQLGMVLPVVFYQEGDLSSLGKDRILSSTATKDLRFYLQLKILGANPQGPPPKGLFLSFVGGITVPSGDRENFSGEETVTGDTIFITEYIHKFFAVSMNIGARLRKETEFFDSKLGSQTIWSLSGTLFLWKRRLVLLGEYFGALWLSHVTSSKVNTEFRGGIGYFFGKSKELFLSIGGGIGIGKSPLSSLVQLYFNISYQPNKYDSDGDGIPDEKDECVDRSEDKDNYSDEDGCPEFDNDEDGIEDSIDQCKEEPEDKDQFKDEDGCPDPENDSDGNIIKEESEVEK